MAYGYRKVNNNQLNHIVERLTSPTRASSAWHHDYDAQETHVRYLRKRDPRFQPQRSVSPKELDHIVVRLTRPTTASTANCWNFDNQDANLAYLKKVDHCIQIPFRSKSVACTLGDSDPDGGSPVHTKSRISINHLPTSRTASATPKFGFWATCGRSVNPSQLLDAANRLSRQQRSRYLLRETSRSAAPKRDESPVSDEEGEDEVAVKVSRAAPGSRPAKASQEVLAC